MKQLTGANQSRTAIHLTLLMLAMVSLLQLPAALWATTYYVSASGNDTNSGTSHLEAWKTTNKVNSAFNNTMVSHNVLFHCGDVWTMGGTNPTLEIDWNGTTENPVVIGAYYLDTDGVTEIRGVQGTKPEFDGNSAYPTAGGNASLISMDSLQHVVFENFRLRRSLARGLHIKGTTQNYDLKILNVDVDHTYREGITIYSVKKGLIDGCDFSYTDEELLIYPAVINVPGFYFNSYNTEVSLQNCSFHENYGYAIRLSAYNTFCTVQNNLVYNSKSGYHILLGYGSSDCEFRNNVIIGITNPPPPGWPVTPAEGIRINDSGSAPSVTTRRNRIYNNLIANCKIGINISTQLTLTDTFVYQNTLVDNLTNLDIRGPFSNCAVRNNIIWSISGAVESKPIYQTSFLNLSLDHNFWSVTPTAGACGPGDIYGAEPMLYKTTGWRSIPPGGLSASDCELAALSPAVDAGSTSLGAAYAVDITGTARPRLLGWDMGAWELKSTNQMEQLSLSPVPFNLLYTETTANLMAQINCQAFNYDVLHSLHIDNAGSAIAVRDLTNLRLWHRPGGAGMPFDPAQATSVGPFIPLDENSWSVQPNLTLQDNDALYITVDIPAGAKGGNTIQFSLPAGGAVFQFSRPLELTPLVNPFSQGIRSPTLLTLDTAPVGMTNLIQGQTNQPLGRIELNNVSGGSLSLMTLQLDFRAKSGLSQNPGLCFSQLRLLRGSQTLSIASSPFPLGALFSFSPAVVLTNQESMALNIYADILDAPALEGFQLQLADAAAVNSGQIQSSPVEGKLFPLTVADANIRPPSAEAVFSSFPNPFRPGAGPMRIAYYLEAAGQVDLSIWTLSGRRVATLEQADKPAGLFETPWDGKNAQGRSVVSGPYLLRLELRYAGAPAQRFSRKFVVAR